MKRRLVKLCPFCKEKISMDCVTLHTTMGEKKKRKKKIEEEKLKRFYNRYNHMDRHRAYTHVCEQERERLGEKGKKLGVSPLTFSALFFFFK